MHCEEDVMKITSTDSSILKLVRESIVLVLRRKIEEEEEEV